MRVALVGATGALGRAAIPRLIRAGHHVVATTRDPGLGAELAAAGAEVATVDLFDAASLQRMFDKHSVEAVVHAAKAIPKRGPVTYRDMRATNRLHDAGTRALVTAALEAGVARFVATSVVFVYGYGDVAGTALTEHASTSVAVPRGCAPIHAAAVSMERQVLAVGDRMQPVVLRTGVFYGPRATDRLVGLLRHRAAPVPRGEGLWPLVYVDDAADAVVAALTAPPGTYNVVDREPVDPRQFLDAVAKAFGTPRPWRVPRPIMAAVAPYFTAIATTRLPVVASRAAALGWQPRHPTYRDGLAAWVAAARGCADGDA